MIFEWDEAKRIANLAKHGVDFELVREFDWSTAYHRRDARRDYGEPRWFSLGLIGNRIHALVFTWRSGRVRVISMRKASEKERLDYEETRRA